MSFDNVMANSLTKKGRNSQRCDLFRFAKLPTEGFTKLSKFASLSNCTNFTMSQFTCKLSTEGFAKLSNYTYLQFSATDSARSNTLQKTCKVSAELAHNARRLGGRAGIHKGLDGRQTSKIPVRCPTSRTPPAAKPLVIGWRFIIVTFLIYCFVSLEIFFNYH